MGRILNAARAESTVLHTAGDRSDALSEAFAANFEVVIADTEALVEEALALRYQVYCLERGYEDPDSNSDGRERDEYDCRAVHGLVRRRQSGDCVGAVRLVLSDRSDPSQPFPIEAACAQAFSPDLQERLRDVPRHRLAEISRFAVSKHYRRRFSEANYIQGLSPHVEYCDADAARALQNRGRLFPQVTLGLFAAVVRLSAMHDVTHWYAVMEPSLLRLLRRFGIYFTPVGSIVEYHGRRQPTLADASEVVQRARAERLDIWKAVIEQR